MVGAGQQLACSHIGDTVESGGLLAAAARRPLQHVHQVGDEEVILQRRHTLLRQDRGLAAHRAGKREAVGRDVILQAPEGRENKSKSVALSIVELFLNKGCRSIIPRLCVHSPLTEGVQAGQHFGVLVAVQTYAADQELFVNLAYHRAGESGAFTGHPKSLGSLSLSHRTLPSETGLNSPARDPYEVGGAAQTSQSV